MLERYNGLLKSGLNLDTNSLWGWSVHLWAMLWHLNEKPQKGALIPVGMLIHLAASPVQLLQTKKGAIAVRIWPAEQHPAASPNFIKP